MGMWTSAGIGYGYKIDHDDRYRLPWYATDENDETLFNGDHEEWWLAVNGWDDAKERPTVPHYVGMSDEEAMRSWDRERKIRPEWDDYFDRKQEFAKTIPPLPFRIKSSGHCDYAATMLLALDEVKVSQIDAVYHRVADRRQLVEAVAKYGIDVGDQQPQWHAFGYYG